MFIWKLKRIAVFLMILVSMLLVFQVDIVQGAPGGNVTVSNVSPANQSIGIEIVGNPPESTGYVNISFTLSDSNGGNDMEFFLNVSSDGGATWTNRLHQSGVSNGSWYQHETVFSTTNTTYYWNVSYRDGSEEFLNNIYHFRSEARPEPPNTPSPINGTMVREGYVSLSVVVHHPDGASAPPMNVTFHEYPSGRVIGYNLSSRSNGELATCNLSYNCFYNGTKYYWYANTTDDEFNSDNSSIWFVETWYNDSELDVAWYSLGIDFSVESVYVGSESNAMWYTLGEEIRVRSLATFSNPYPANASTNQLLNLVLSIDVNTTTPKYKDFIMRPDADGTSIQCNESGDTENWKCVDEVSADDNTTYIYTDDSLVYDLDLYNLPNHTAEQHGDELNVSVFFRCMNNTSPACNGSGFGTAKPSVRIGGTTYNGSETTVSGTWATYNYTWDLNPNTGLEWTWEEIDNLSAGIHLKGTNCTQLYVDVHYRQSIMLLTTQFYTNDTVDGRWEQIGSDVSEQRTNYTATQHFSGLQFSARYYWKARVYNTTVDYEENSSIYYFETEPPSPEPDTVWYSIGGDVWVELTYADSEPNDIWYTLGGNITLAYNVSFSNESPASGTTGLWKSLVLLVQANKTGDPVHYNFTFYTNDTVNGNWTPIGTLNQQVTNITLTMSFSGLQFSKTYWWKVLAVNDTLGTNLSSSVYYFGTGAPPLELDTVWYPVGIDLWVESVYVDSEPNAKWYTLGLVMTCGAPYAPIIPTPANGSWIGKHVRPNFMCYVEDPQGYRMNVSFYNSSDDSLLGTDTYVASGDFASIPVGGISNYTWYRWYAVANNSPDTGTPLETSSISWWYLPGNRVPTVTLIPDEGDIGVPLRRMMVGGAYQDFVRLNWTISDIEGDEIDYHAYVDDPAIGGWDDWISRWHVADAGNGTYIQDETLFDAVETSYSWRLNLSDQFNDTVYTMNFTTDFLFWADFNWTPYRATTNDTVQFIDLSQNATDYWWYINGVLVANTSGILASAQFNTTYNFNISNVYNITLEIRNETCENEDQMTRYIYIDRNLSLNRSTLSAIVYHGESPNATTNASELCSNIGIMSNAWVHMYNTTNEEWVSYWVDFPSITTDFDISLWDALAFVISENKTKQLTITKNPDQREIYYSRTSALANMSDATQTLTLPAGLNYVCWSNVSSTTSYNLSIGMTATEDRVYKYDTQTGVFSTYWLGVAGVDFAVTPYDVMILSLGATRTITIEDGFP